MITGFQYTRHEIDDIFLDQADGIKTAVVTWRHLAIGREDNVMYPIQEISALEQGEDGNWLYIGGDVQRPPTESGNEMVQSWPGMVGLKLKPKGDGTVAAPLIS